MQFHLFTQYCLCWIISHLSEYYCKCCQYWKKCSSPWALELSTYLFPLSILISLSIKIFIHTNFSSLLIFVFAFFLIWTSSIFVVHFLIYKLIFFFSSCFQSSFNVKSFVITKPHTNHWYKSLFKSRAQTIVFSLFPRLKLEPSCASQSERKWWEKKYGCAHYHPIKWQIVYLLVVFEWKIT